MKTKITGSRQWTTWHLLLAVCGAQAQVELQDSFNFERASKWVEESEYNINWQPKAEAYQSPNRAQNLRFTYGGSWFRAERRLKDGPTDDWSIRLKLKSVVGTTVLNVSEDESLTVTTRRAVAKSEGVSIEYTNSMEGMRQNFIIESSPGSDLVCLHIHATLKGVTMSLNQEQDYLCFTRENEEVMRYADLTVWDADGTALPARFKLLSDAEVAIVVETENARFPIVVDPLSFSPGWQWFGPVPPARFGHSVAIGRFRVATYRDIIVGAPYFDSGAGDEGRVFVWYGRMLNFWYPEVPDWTASCSTQGALLGCSLATADVNGDGWDDLIVGARGWSSQGYSQDGAAFVWLTDMVYGLSGEPGGPQGIAPDNADWSYYGRNTFANFGASVAKAGFVRGSEYPQDAILVGAPSFDYSYNCTGKAFLFYGGANGPSLAPDWTAVGTSRSSFGNSVATAGDVNSDGFADVIVGAPNYTGYYAYQGAAYVYHGSPTYGQLPFARMLTKAQQGAQFGWSVATAGDVNGDGHSDVLVGAPFYSQGSYWSEGFVFAYYGSDSGVPAAESWSAESLKSDSRFGYSVSSTQDLDSDGYSDIVIGSPYYTPVPGPTHGGGVFVWRGSSAGLAGGVHGTPWNSDWWIVNVKNNNAYAGWSVTGGELAPNGGLKGILWGAPGEVSVYNTYSGAVALWLLTP